MSGFDKRLMVDDTEMSGAQMEKAAWEQFKKSGCCTVNQGSRLHTHLQNAGWDQKGDAVPPVPGESATVLDLVPPGYLDQEDTLQ